MKKKKKVILGIVITLAIILLSVVGYNSFNFGKKEENPETLKAYTYVQVEEGDEAIDGTDYVKFDAYYLRDLNGDGYAEKLRGTCKEIGTEDTLYMDLSVITNGTLKDAKITINGKNFYLNTAIVRDNIIAQDYINSNTKEIRLNDIQNGTQKLITGVVRTGDYSSYIYRTNAIEGNVNNYSVMDNTVTLTGTHVADDGTETEISKTVMLTNDWYGNTNTRLNADMEDDESQEYNINEALDNENNTLNIEFLVRVSEIEEELELSRLHLEGEMPLINGYAPLSVEIVTGRVDSYSYDNSNRIFTIEQHSDLQEDGKVKNSMSSAATYKILAKYPLIAYTSLGGDAIAMNIPLKAWYEGYNNESFQNPYRSNVAQRNLSIVYNNPKGDVAILDVYVGKYVKYNEDNIGKRIVSKEKPLNIYNQVNVLESDRDLYTVAWDLSTGPGAFDTDVKIMDTPENRNDCLVDNNGDYYNIGEHASNVGIYFMSANVMLKSDGYINVYNDDTNELIHTFTSDEWGDYTEENPYMYNEKIKHVRVELYGIKKNAFINIIHVKEIDDLSLTSKYTREQFDSFNKLYSYATAYLNVNNEYQKINSNINFAEYQSPVSVANLSISPDSISNQETKKNIIIKVNSAENVYNSSKWKDGQFIIKYPKDIIDVNVNSIQSMKNGLEIVASETYEKDGNVYTKIYTSSENETDVEFNVDLDITANPTSPTSTQNIELYSYNPNCHNYDSEYTSKDIYDINNDGNLNENIGYSNTVINLVAPSSLLTSQIATNFDDSGSIVIAPKIAVIAKKDSTSKATVNINLTNNYSGTISEIKIIGKIPFEGNTYQLNGEELGSEFNTTMTSDGIKLPDELKNKATVYYSYNENTTEDISDSNNEWTKSPADMSRVKTFLVDLEDYVMSKGETQVFTYDIEVPGGLEYNSVSYSDHAIYFCLDTSEGKLQTQVEPNKLGFMIAKKFNFEVTKYEYNTDKKLSGVTFVAEDLITNNSTSATTLQEGVATLKDLYVEREYKIKEVSADKKYVISDNEATIIGHEVNGKLEIEIIDGEFKNTPVIDYTNTNPTVKVDVEDEVKYHLEVYKTEQSTSDPISGIRFRLVGTNGLNTECVTSINGKLNLNYLEPNVQYTLTETDSLGHYLKDPISFMMVRDSNKDLKFNVLSGDLDELPQIDKAGEIPVVRINLENEKIPTYKLKITKVEKESGNTLEGAQFKISGENKDEEIYTTGEDGTVEISDLYEYVEGKNVIGEYVLEEIYSPEGYVLDQTPIIFRAQRNASGRLVVDIKSGSVDSTSVTSATSDEPTINFTIENDPVFSLTKVDDVTGEPLEGVKFKITDTDGDYVTDASGNPVGEFLSSKENLEFYSEGTYQWKENYGNIWESGNNGHHDTTSTITSDSFELNERTTISFDWSVSSESRSYDYLYYVITNIDTNDTIGGTSTKIGGTDYGEEYENLVFETVEVELDPGRYNIAFVYRKDSSQSVGLDKGYIKNLKINTSNYKVIGDERVVVTDENGKINLNLKEGFYTITEVNPKEGYEDSAISETFGIGKSKPAVYEEGIREAWSIEQESYEPPNISWSAICKGENDTFAAVSSYGQIAIYSIDGELIYYNEDYRGDEISDVVNIPGGYLTTTLAHEDLLKITDDGEVIVIRDDKFGTGFSMFAGYIDGNIILVGNEGIQKCDSNGNVIWENKRNHFSFGGVYDLLCLDEGYVVAADENLIMFDSNTGDVLWQNDDNRNDMSFETELVQYEDGFLITDGEKSVKYNLEGKVEYETSYVPEHYSREEIELDDGYIKVEEYGSVLTRYENYEYLSEPSIPEVQKFTFENSKKEYKITTEVEGTGGKISGQNQNPYERVRHGEDSVKDLIITPNSGYKVVKITINGQEISYIPNEDGIVELDKFINMTSDKHIVVSFSNNASDIIVHHYIKDTTTSLAPDEVKVGEIDEQYTTSPKSNLQDYQLVKNEDGSYQIPENASGVFTEETQVVTYYYEKKPLQLIVHHYIDGTEDSVAPDEVSEGQEGQEYMTSPVEYPELDEKYELVQEKLPENASGTLEDKVTEVIYYYRVKEHKITTEVDGVGGIISGQGETPYETVLHNEDSVKDIIITPNEGYELESITINGKEQELPEDKLAEYTLDKFTNMVEDKHIVVRFEPLKQNITVNKVWEDNSNSAGKRPKEIEIQLYNGSTLVSSIKLSETETVSNNWNGIFENIPMYDESGNQINYTVVEKEVNTNDLYFYETSIEQTGGDVFTITNTFNVPEETIDIEVTKKWEDSSNENGLRPQEIKLQLKNGEEVVQEQVINVESGNEQRYTFTGLDKYDENGNEIRYTVDESEVNEEDLKFYSKQIDNEKHAITNTFTVPDEKISIEVTKKWEDESNVNETRPSQIVIQVKNGEEVVQSNTVDVTEEDEKVYTFTDLAKYDENGKEIEYIVDETEVNKDELIGYEKKIDGKVITNTIKSHKITTEVKGEGGTISGQDEDPYEEVLHKGDSVKDIVITQNEGYEIAKITINGEEQELPENVKEEYTLDKFKEVTEDKHVVVEFKKIEYKITTEVEGDGGIISGEGESPYESVVHGENSVKNIICTPEYGYKIESITVNGEQIEFTPNEEDKYTLDKFINMTEDKHIVVKYEKKDTSIVVKHVDEEGNNLIEPETIEGKVGDSYNTEEKEFEEYEIKTIPENADGEMEEEQIEVIYVYSKVKGKVTITKVDKEDTSKLLEGATYKIEKLDDEGNVDETFISQEKTTGEDGEVEFSELTVGKYKITEIKAPEGYELSKSNIEVEITKAEREVDLTATNLLKLELPETGSIGLAIFTVAGITVMSVAFILNKKQKVQE